VTRLVADLDCPTAAPDSPGRGPGTQAPWVLVVARGQARLLAELQAMFRSDPQVLVIEARRQEHPRLPCGEALYDLRFPIS
jgi:hypothetical protein